MALKYLYEYTRLFSVCAAAPCIYKLFNKLSYFIRELKTGMNINSRRYLKKRAHTHTYTYKIEPNLNIELKKKNQPTNQTMSVEPNILRHKRIIMLLNRRTECVHMHTCVAIDVLFEYYRHLKHRL